MGNLARHFLISNLLNTSISPSDYRNGIKLQEKMVNILFFYSAVLERIEVF